MRFQRLKRDDFNGPWLDITYFHYWDGVRTFHLRFKERDLIFDSLFLSFRDAYSDYFLVYLIDGYNAESYKNLNPKDIVDIVPLDKIMFDETLRSGVFLESIDRLFGNFEAFL